MSEHDMNRNEQDRSAEHEPPRDEASLPLGIGGVEEEGGFDAVDVFGADDDDERRGLNSGALLLTAVVLIAGIGLYSMRTITRATAATDVPTEAEKSIESFLTMRQSAQDPDRTEYMIGAGEIAVLDVLNETYASRQVSLDHVQRNPFIIFGEDAASTIQPGADPAARKRNERQRQFEQAAARLELRSVLLGNPPLANINNNIVQVGATVAAPGSDVTFRVRAITTDVVELIAEDPQLGVSHEVRLSIDRDGSSRPGQQRSGQRGSARPR